METLVATVLIVIIFMASSLVLNNLFASSIRFNDNEVRKELWRLQYLHRHKKLKLPHNEKVGEWSILVSKNAGNNGETVLFNAKHSSGDREISIEE